VLVVYDFESSMQTVGDTSDFVNTIYDILMKDYSIMGKTVHRLVLLISACFSTDT